MRDRRIPPRLRSGFAKIIVVQGVHHGAIKR